MPRYVSVFSSLFSKLQAKCRILHSTFCISIGDANATSKYQYGHLFTSLTGPCGLSRVDLAQELCAVTGMELLAHEAKQEGVVDTTAAGDQDEGRWVVFKSFNSDVFITPGVQNPRDVTMDSDRVYMNFTPLNLCKMDNITIIIFFS